MTETEDLQLEQTLRGLLSTVGLVCEADVPAELVDAAERALRPLIKRHDFATCARRFPATLTTYFVIRGAEVYSRNKLWEHLGIRDRTSEAGQAFLRALHTLGLPDFADQTAQVNARRYVAAILLHGALPSYVARRLVHELENELRLGLVDGAEARRRLLRQPDIEFTLRRPAVRLLDWCPEYAESLLDAIIDHIESPSGDALRRLPRHLQEALEQDVERRQGLRRLRTPYVEFLHWTGIGPEVVGVDGTSWVLTIGEQASRIQADDRQELRPGIPAHAAGAGRRVPLWGTEQVAFFDVRGRAVPPDDPIPAACVALLPRRWALWTESGDLVPEVAEGLDLTGPWSGHRSCEVALRGFGLIHAGPRDQPGQCPVTLRVDSRQEPALVGQQCPEAITGASGAAVYTLPPAIDLPGSTADEVRVRFHPVQGAPKHGVARRVAGPGPGHGHYSLDDVLAANASSNPRACAGEIEVLGSTARLRLRFAVVPDLHVVRPDRPLAPADPALVLATAAPGVLEGDGELVVAPDDVLVDLLVVGLPTGTVRVPVPRVQWALRSTNKTRLELAVGVIRADAALLAEPHWLIVRSAVSADIGLRLVADGVDVQRIGPRRTAAMGSTEHHRSLALAELRDTIRSHRDAHIELILTVDGRAMTAVVCQGTAERMLRPTNDRHSDREPDNSVLSSVPWLQDQVRERSPEIVAGSDRLLLAQLRQADAPDAVVMFLRVLATRHRTWRVAEFPNGPSAQDWASVNDVADELWGVNGVRLREFAGQPDERRQRWARARRETLRRAPEPIRRDFEQWLLGRRPQPDLLASWQHLDVLRSLLPNKKTVTAEWLPAAIAYHMLAVIGGDDESGPAVTEAMKFEPRLVLEALAMILQLLRTGIKIHRPVIEAACDDSEPLDDIDEPTLPSLVSLAASGVTVAVTDRQLLVMSDVECASPSVRLSAGGRAAAILTTNGDGYRFEAALPRGLAGPYRATVVDARSVPIRPRAQIEVDVPRDETPRVRCTQRCLDPENLADAQHDLIVDQLGLMLERGIVSRPLVDELFYDEHSGAAALVRAARRGVEAANLERIVIACLPAAMLFADLGVADVDGIKRNELLFAALAPRRPDRWRFLGWPNVSRFDAGRSMPEDLVGFSLRMARDVTITSPTFRYAPSTDYPDHGRLDQALQFIEQHPVDPGFLDVMVATHRMLTIDALVEEAMTTLLEVHRSDQRGAARAVVAGIAATLATGVHRSANKELAWSNT